MHTVIVWDEMEGDIKFAVVSGDQTRFNECYINNCEDDELVDALNKLQESEEFASTLGKTFPYQAVKDGAKVIVCGFIP